MDVTARLPGCAGQAADAISAYTQVKMEDAPSLLKIPKSDCPYIWIRLPKHKWPKSWSSRTIMGKAIRESSVGTRLGKSSSPKNVYL